MGLLVWAVVACGGGGGGGGSDPPQGGGFNFSSAQLTLSGDQEVVPTITGAVGIGTLTLASPTLVLSGGISVNGMVATAANIHQGDTGVNGPVIVTLLESSAGNGNWSVPAGTTLTQAQARAFADGGLYFNAHSSAYPGGEIRGQIGRNVFMAQMTSAQEVPSNPSSAFGNGVVSLDLVTRKFSARINVVGMATNAAHIHSGAQGANGPVLFSLSEAAPGTWVAAADATMTDAQLAVIRAGGLYFNAHSSAFPNGQIRGQIGRNVRFASLSPAQEVPPVMLSTASGTGTLVLDPLTRAASGGITIAGMTAIEAHIHQAATGVNGPVIVTLVNTSPGVWGVPAGAVLTAEQFKAYKQGELYFNAHSVNQRTGEIRGQIL